MSDSTHQHTLAEGIGALVGGPDNVSWFGSCTTRLRFIVNDDSRVDYDALAATPGVMQAVRAGGQVQIVIGTHVDQVRADLSALPGWSALERTETTDTKRVKQRPLDVVFGFLGSTFQPLIPAITGAAMVQVLSLLLIQFAGLDPENPTALILNATGNAIFYFLPLFVAFTASRTLGANPFIGTTIAAALLHPSFTQIGETGNVANAFGLPLFMYTYASSMFPALLIALSLAGLDRVLKRILPRPLQQVFVPTFELLLLVPLTVLLFGPVGSLVGQGIGSGVSWLSETAPFVFYVVVPALWIFLVAMGVHWAIISIAIADLAATGTTVILGAAMGYQYAIMGIAIAVLIKVARDRRAKTLRDTASAATVAATIGGITEPTVYGLVLPYRRILVIQMITAGVSGGVLGAFGAVLTGFSPAPILGIPLMQPILAAVLAMVVAVVLAIVLVQVWGYEKRTPASATAEDHSAGADSPTAAGFQGAVDSAANADVTIPSPITGTLVPLAETGDPVFSGGLIGQGIAIMPVNGRVVAPCDATVVALPASSHAIGLRTDAGVELLIHVGIDTVKLGGEHFTPRVAQGARVRAGELLLEFDVAAIAAAGYSVVTPVLVTNATAGQEVTVTAIHGADAGDPLLTVRARESAAA